MDIYYSDSNTIGTLRKESYDNKSMWEVYIDVYDIVVNNYDIQSISP